MSKEQIITVEYLDILSKLIYSDKMFASLDVIDNEIDFKKVSLIIQMPFTLNKVIVKKINNKNKVFTTENIKKGDVITIFSPDAIEYRRPNSENYEYDFGPRTTEKFEKKLKNNLKEEILLLDIYKFKINDEYSIIGDPENISNSTYLGHICNTISIKEEKKCKRIFKKNKF